MLTFDKLKIVVQTLDCINDINTKKFNTITKNGEIAEYKYQQATPYLLFIEKDIADGEFIIEYTGKILGTRYNELINANNIRQCLENVNALGICTLDVDEILKEGRVVKADVTIDAEYSDIASLTRELQASIVNNERYITKNMRGNFIVEKNVKTANRKLRLTIYDKEHEMSLQENHRWLQSYSDAEVKNLINHFKGKIRFELNLNSIKAIIDGLCIQDNSILSVLNAEANPIMSFLDKILVDSAEAHVVRTLRDEERLALLKANDYNMKAIENIIRLHKAPSTKLSDTIKPYQELYQSLHANKQTSLKERLRKVLLEIF